MFTRTPAPTRRTPPTSATPQVVDALIAALADRPASRQEWARLARVRLQAQREGANRG